jgi:NAD(P)-dependent dehydrogenase (short-subunit alcohol dehydrogenase family)
MKLTTRMAVWGAKRVARRVARRKLERNRGKLLMVAGGVGAAIAGGIVVRRLTMADLTDQVVLITGGSRGLGFLLAGEFARHGCRVVICARDESELERARLDLERHNADVLAVQCDVTDPSAVERMLEKARNRFGRVDILVNNAGTIQVGPVEAMTARDFEESMRLMFWGVLYPTLTVLPDMLERKSGRIVNITSIGGKVSMPHLLPYGCA